MIRIDLWHLRTDAIDPVALKDRALGLLSAVERDRYERFVFDKNKHEYLATRLVARSVLGRYIGKAPIELTFTITEHGRPLLDAVASGGVVDLRFSLTNTLSLIACAVRDDGGEVGIDAEPLARGKEVLSIASTVFMNRERAELATLDMPAQERRAVELWTLKEAYMKARGLGMSIPPDRFELTPDGLLVFHDPIVDDPKRWLLRTVELEAHLVSLCVERRTSGEEEEEDEQVDVRIQTVTA